MRVLISGGSGFIGRALAGVLLNDNYDVLVYTHGRERNLFSDKRITVLTKDDPFPEVDAIVNLSGERIDKRRLDKNRLRLILSSRTDTIKLLHEKYKDRKISSIHFIQASATGIYKNGSCNDESGELADTVYADICREIESTALSFFDNVTLARFGVVAGPGGGLMRNLRFMPKIRFFNGCNTVPCISLPDCARALKLTLEKKLLGPVNFCSDRYLTLNELMDLCAGIRFIKLVCPSFILNLDKRCDLLKADQKIKPSRLLSEGFVFQQISTRNDL